MKSISNLHLDYIAEIYQVSHVETNGAGDFVSSAELAQRMFTSQSSINRIIERLNSLELVDYQRYVGVKLNDAGQQEAIKLQRKQSIIEAFLIHTLKFEWHEVYQEARQMCHHVSEGVLNRMWDITGQPQRSPFGDWIDPPPASYSSGMMLSDAEASQHYTIDRILTRQSDRLQYLSALGLMPTVPLQFLHKAPFDGPLQIQLDHEYRILGHELSQMITVIPVNA